MRWLAIDYGRKRIGLAISDPELRIALPFKTINREGSDVFKEIASIVVEKEISKIIVGNPLLLSGEEGNLSKEVKEFVEALRDILPDRVAIVLIDERLTTKMAEKLMKERGLKPSREKDKLNMIAATVLLQGVLDSKEEKI
jgi:putative Holliday junction resolvase